MVILGDQLLLLYSTVQINVVVVVAFVVVVVVVVPCHSVSLLFSLVGVL